MKVLLDLQYLNVATTGIKTYMMELAKAAIAFPHPEVEWIFSHDLDLQATNKTFKNPQSKIQKLNYHLNYFVWKQFQLPALVKKIQPDVLICPDFVSPIASLDCRRLTVIHDAFFWQMPQNYPKCWRTYFLNIIKKGLKQQTEMITTTEYAKKSLQDHLKLDLPIHVIYQSPKSLRNQLNSSFLEENGLKEKGYFLHVGTFDVRKNIPLLVRAFSDFLAQTGSDLKLVLAGGPAQSKQMNDFSVIKDLVLTLELEDSVILPGYLIDSEINTLYQGAFGYVFPSENEGFGIPIIEAMGCGIPVIHSEQEALLEVAGGAGLTFSTVNQQDLAKKMILLNDNKMYYDELVKKGYERSKHFSPQKFIHSFYQILLTAI